MGVFYGRKDKTVILTYQGTSNITASQSTFTHTNVSVGTEYALRRILIATGTSNTSAPISITSATIGGVTASILLQQTGDLVGAGYAHTAFLTALVPTGTTATIIVNYSTTVLRNYVGIYNVVGWDGTLYSSGGDPSFNGAILSVSNISVPTNGVVIGNALGARDSISVNSFTWSINTVDYNDQPATGRVHSGARQSYSSQTSSITVDATLGLSGSPVTGAAGSLTVIGIGPPQ